MSTEPSLILIVGAADTGRAPIAAALLRRLLGQRALAWQVASAGVVGHDAEPAQPEARDALTILGIDISQHQARSLTPVIAAEARILLSTDSGVARVVRAHYPQATTLSLGELAGRQRDIPDPFRMQVGAWLSYAREIESLLIAGIDRLIREVIEEAPPQAGPPDQPEPASSPALPDLPERRAAIERSLRLLALLAELPDVIDWAGARRQIEADLPAMGTPFDPTDMARPYAAMIQAMLGLTPQPPTPAQSARLRIAIEALRSPVSTGNLAKLSSELARYPTL